MSEDTRDTDARTTPGEETGGREHQIVRAFLDLSHELVDDYDVVEMLARLTTNCASLLDVASAGLLLADSGGFLRLAASSSERTHHLEVLQLQRAEGPCLDCFREGRAVIVPDLGAAQQRWPQFARAALLAGFESVHALPMRLRDNVLGTLGLFGESTGGLDDDDLALAQALAHVASVSIVNEKSSADRSTISSQLQRALTSRIALEQAKGILADTGGLSMEDAFAVLRGYARAHARRLSDVAADLVDRRLTGEQVLQHAGPDDTTG